MGAHREWLRVPLWWWPIGVAVGGLLAAEIGFGVPGIRTWLAYLIVLPCVAGLLWWVGRIEVRIAPDDRQPDDRQPDDRQPDDRGTLCVDDARLPLRFVAAARPLTGEARRRVLGPELDPLAFVVQRPWVDGVVQVLLDDPADPTPYWVISTRHPVALAAALDPGGTPASSST